MLILIDARNAKHTVYLLIFVVVFFLSDKSISSEDLTVNNICEKYDDIHLINDVDLFTEDSLVAVVEIPSGTTEKWEVDKETGNLNLEYKNSKPRNINDVLYL